ncbi:metallophosphoesterase family protein [bacterium]|nr:metallophosphoesterase family protein [bacterium]
MKIALVSDVHGNLDALLAVLEDLERRGCRQIYCCGDVVGYGAEPNECCRVLRAYWAERPLRPYPVVLGNHDEAVAILTATPNFNPHAARAADWTRRQLSPDNCAWLASLPFQISLGPMLLSHATAAEPGEWRYLIGEYETDRDLAWFTQHRPERFYAVGHSHYPFIQSREGRHQDYEMVQMEEDLRYAVNVGSVGQPRDGDARACYAVFDDAAMTLQLVRVGYDVAMAQRRIRAAGLPALLAERLAAGR